LSSIDQCSAPSASAPDGYPLAVLMGVGENEAMADYYEHRNAYFLVAAIVSLLICTAGFVMYQMVLRLKKSKFKQSRPTA
jgi:hypothetical protein